MNIHPLLPLLIRTRDSGVAYLLGNQKSYEKSLEQGEIWYVHPITLRVLSLPHSQGCPIRFLGTHYEADWLDAHPPILPDVAAESTDSAPDSTETELRDKLAFLEELTRLIRQRRQSLPEGSYTTHLFQKGEAKIRKKTGEEAVELILAQSRDELASEAADLIYHLMVLLEVNSLDLGHVLDVLARRHR